MTEKKMDPYCRAVKRRLNLPREIKERVMTDFVSDIEARRERGMTDAEILAELGTPKKAAEELNDQMKEYAYRKSPWRFLFAALAIYGLWEVLGALAAMLLYLAMSDPLTEASSVGIIGGADGPTAVFVTTSTVLGWQHYIIPLVALAAGIWGFYRLCRCKQK